MGVPVSSASPGRDEHSLAGLCKVVQKLFSFEVVDNCAEGDRDLKIAAILSMPSAAFAMPAAFRAKGVVVAKLEESIFVGIGGHVNVAAIAAVSAAGPPSGDELFSSKRNAPMSSVSCTDRDLGFIDEHGKEPVILQAAAYPARKGQFVRWLL